MTEINIFTGSDGATLIVRRIDGVTKLSAHVGGYAEKLTLDEALRRIARGKDAQK